jgi:hypothetical protein
MGRMGGGPLSFGLEQHVQMLASTPIVLAMSDGDVAIVVRSDCRQLGVASTKKCLLWRTRSIVFPVALMSRG